MKFVSGWFVVRMSKGDLAMDVNTKHAALLLHTLSKRDAKWVLGQLTVSERDRLANAVKTIKSNNLFLDKEVVGLALSEGAIRANENQIFHNPENIEKAIKILESEPAWIISALSICTEWPWLIRYIDDLDYVKKAKIKTCANNIKNKLTPIVETTIKEEFLRLVDDSE